MDKNKTCGRLSKDWNRKLIQAPVSLERDTLRLILLKYGKKEFNQMFREWVGKISFEDL